MRTPVRAGAVCLVIADDSGLCRTGPVRVDPCRPGFAIAGAGLSGPGRVGSGRFGQVRVGAGLPGPARVVPSLLGSARVGPAQVLTALQFISRCVQLMNRIGNTAERMCWAHEVDRHTARV